MRGRILFLWSDHLSPIILIIPKENLNISMSSSSASCPNQTNQTASLVSPPTWTPVPQFMLMPRKRISPGRHNSNDESLGSEPCRGWTDVHMLLTDRSRCLDLCWVEMMIEQEQYCCDLRKQTLSYDFYSSYIAPTHTHVHIHTHAYSDTYTYLLVYKHPSIKSITLNDIMWSELPPKQNQGCNQTMRRKTFPEGFQGPPSFQLPPSVTAFAMKGTFSPRRAIWKPMISIQSTDINQSSPSTGDKVKRTHSLSKVPGHILRGCVLEHKLRSANESKWH